MSWIQALVASADVERRATLEKILGECGLDTVLASNTEEVRIILLQEPIHLVFCEDNLPEGDFRAILRLAKATRPDAHVVVSSLLGEWDAYLEAMQLGAFDFIAPPYRGPEILSIVNSVCPDYLVKQTQGEDPLPHSGRSVVSGRQGNRLRRYAS